MNLKYSLLIIGALSLGLGSCVSSGDNPGIEYAPQMYVSQAYEPYTQAQEFENNPNGMTMRMPVAGTVARGQLDFQYPYPNTGEGYVAAAAFSSEIPVTAENIAEGERLYNYACWHCHGKSGKNDGPIFKSGKMPGPSWADVQADYIKNIPMGQMYHTITYGKGLMGSHAHILNPTERWQVIYHIKSMSLGDAFFNADSNVEAEPTTDEDTEEETTVAEEH